MRRIFLLMFILLSAQAYADLRAEKHQEATKIFEDLNFFYKGRGMIISPDLIRLYEPLRRAGVGVSDYGILNKRWGLNLVDNHIKGIFNIPYKRMNMGVLGCVACHGGKAAGKFVIGLGNKNIDVGQIGTDTYMAQFFWGVQGPVRSQEFKDIHKRAMKFTSILKNKKINNLTQGLVPTSQVKSWFYEIAGKGIPENFGRGQVKVPHLWGYGEKRKNGSFWDGFANGVLPGWAVAVELRGGQSPENVREYLDKVHKAEDVLSDLLPPEYPFDHNELMAKKGEKLFNKMCSSCHGVHQRDEQGHPIYTKTKIIPWKIVKTDKERLDFVTDEFLTLIETSPLNDLMQYNKDNPRGYVAPSLWGIWSRFPYLHNASVPTLMDLLKPASERPIVFDLYKSGEEKRFDRERLGLKVNRKTSSRAYKSILRKGKRGARHIYLSSRVGHSNEGHEYEFYKKLTDQARKEIIEYLKTL